MSYKVTQWVDRSSTTAGTKLNATNMAHIEEGIQTIDSALSELSTKVSTIDPKTGTGITDDQVKLLNTVSDNLTAVQNGLNLLKANFEAHVHSNEVGDTTGKVIIETSSTTNA